MFVTQKSGGSSGGPQGVQGGDGVDDAHRETSGEEGDESSGMERGGGRDLEGGEGNDGGSEDGSGEGSAEGSEGEGGGSEGEGGGEEGADGGDESVEGGGEIEYRGIPNPTLKTCWLNTSVQALLGCMTDKLKAKLSDRRGLDQNALGVALGNYRHLF